MGQTYRMYAGDEICVRYIGRKTSTEETTIPALLGGKCMCQQL